MYKRQDPENIKGGIECCYSKDGIDFLDVSYWMDFKQEEETLSLLSFEDIIKTVEEKYGDVINDRMMTLNTVSYTHLIGAEAAGARTMTATSSAGMALMWEMLYVAASNRLPIALALVNRAPVSYTHLDVYKRQPQIQR